MKAIEIMMHEDRNVRLTGYLQEVGGEFGPVEKRPAVIILPGGGYGMCSDREADPVALEFARFGYQTFVLRYTVRATEKELIWPHPIEDYDEAYDLIRSNADEWHVDMDRIATCGFSAGGHLAACTATVAKNRPQAAILVYPAIKEDICDMCAPGLAYPAKEIDLKTPPCFIAAARDDILVNPSNAMAFAGALNDAGINYELHIYSYGNHGFATAAEWLNAGSLSQGMKRWTEDAARFLGEVWGRLTVNGFTKPEISRCVTGDFESHLSVRCTVLHLEKQGEDIEPVIGEAMGSINAMFKERGYTDAVAEYVKTLYTMRAMLESLGTPAEKIDEIDASLSAIETKFPTK